MWVTEENPGSQNTATPQFGSTYKPISHVGAETVVAPVAAQAAPSVRLLMGPVGAAMRGVFGLTKKGIWGFMRLFGTVVDCF